jgi:hypothetical protein
MSIGRRIPAAVASPGCASSYRLYWYRVPGPKWRLLLNSARVRPRWGLGEGDLRLAAANGSVALEHGLDDQHPILDVVAAHVLTHDQHALAMH